MLKDLRETSMRAEASSRGRTIDLDVEMAISNKLIQ